MSAPRVQYREKQILHASDLQDEQQFLLDTLSRHTLNAHSSGILRGLTLRLDQSNAPVVDAGAAMDMAGRQLILERTETLTNQLAEGDASDVWLIFCGEPFRFPIPGRFSCGPNDYGRSREIATVRCVPAGRDAPDPSGVLLGKVQWDGNNFTVDVSNASYVSLRGANVFNPAKTAFLQIGKSAGADPNQLLINITAASGAVTKRLAVDRNGDISVYGNLELSSYRARLLVPSPEENALLLVEAVSPGPAGERITASAELGKKGLNLTFTHLVNGRTESLDELEFSAKKNIREKARAKFTAFNADSRLVRLKPVDAEMAENIPRIDEGEETNLSISGSSILLGDTVSPQADNAQEWNRCQEPIPGSESSKSVNGLSFLAATPPVPGSPARGIYAATLDSKDSQKQEFRLDLGKQQDQDLSTRLSIGALARKDRKFSQWLTVQGNCVITLLDQKRPAKELPTSIKTKGYIEQAPIKADPSDPLFKSLMLAAWLNGLRSAVAASSSVLIAFNGVQNPIVGPDWPYTVDVTNIGQQTLSIDKVLESMTLDGQTVVQSIPYQGNLTVGQTAPLLVPHHGAPETANPVTLEVIISGKIANASWWNSATKTTTVRDPN